MVNDGFVKRTGKNLLAGTVSGIAACLVGHPFDTLKVRLQTQPVHKPVYTGLIDCFVKTLKWEGIGGLYKGIGSPIVGQMFFRATLFTSYFQIQSVVGGEARRGQRLTAGEYFLCGVVTGFCGAFVEGPMDLFKTKMQIQIIRTKSGTEVQYRNVFHAGLDIGRKHGVRGVYQGLGATQMRNIPATGVYFGTYEYARTAMTAEGESVTVLPAHKIFAASGLAGVFYWLSCYPIDVVKSSMQSDEAERSRRRYRSSLHCARVLYQEEGGWRRFYRGFTPCMMRSLPANGAMMLTMETCRYYLM